MNHAKIACRLIGNIKPVGETHVDEKRFENLKTMCGLINDLVIQVNEVACRTHQGEHSIKRSVDYANKFLDNLKHPE